MKRLTACLLTAAAMSLAGGCAKTIRSSEFCAVTTPIRPSTKDALTDGTTTQILKLNKFGERACGWKP
ncbi:hypothetical protein CN204_04140 [Sinorhizobium meliloti]|nr:hypothetical protein CN204_04140 [Sinorhizobium meliloti]